MKNEICKKGFTDFQLKWIALVLMVMDHIHYFSSLQVRYRNGFPCWADYRLRCFCFACWKVSNIPGTVKNIFSGYMSLPWGWGCCSIFLSAL